MFCPFPPQGLCSPSSQGGSSSNQSGLPPEKKHYEKQTTTHRLHGLGLAFRNSWRRKEPEHKPVKKSSSSVIILYDQGFIFISWLKGCLDLLSFLLQYATIEVCLLNLLQKSIFIPKVVWEQEQHISQISSVLLGLLPGKKLMCLATFWLLTWIRLLGASLLPWDDTLKGILCGNRVLWNMRQTN